MDSFVWINGQGQKVRLPSHSSQAATQFTHGPIWNQQPGRADGSYQQSPFNNAVRPLEISNPGIYDGVFSNRQMSNWQTPAVPRQMVSCQQPAGQETNTLKVLEGYVQNSLLNAHNANPPVMNGRQVATRQSVHTNAGLFNPSSRVPANMVKANTARPQQEMSAHLNQQGVDLGRPVWTHMSNLSDPLKNSFSKGLPQNVNAESTYPISACTTTTTSLPREQAICTKNSMSAIEHNRPSAHNQNYQQSVPWREVTHLIPPPRYHIAVSQRPRDGSSAMKSSNEQMLHVSNVSQNSQQHAVNLNSTQNGGQEAACHFTPRTNELDDTDHLQIIARIAEDLRKSFPPAPNACVPVNKSSPYTGKQFVGEVRMPDLNQNKQPLTFIENYNSVASQFLPKTNYNVVPRTSDSLNAPQQNPGPNAFFVTFTGDGCGEIRQPNANGNKEKDAFLTQNSNVSKRTRVGSSADASQSMKWPQNIPPQASKTKSSAEINYEMLENCQVVSALKANDIHSSSGRTSTRAVAVVQPLSQEGSHVADNGASSEMTGQPADKTVIHSAASGDGTVVSVSDSAGLKDKGLCTGDTESELSTDVQTGQTQSENAADPKALVLQLSLVPTIPWTFDKLVKLIQDEEVAQMKLRRDVTEKSSTAKLLTMFWDDEIMNLKRSIAKGWFTKLITFINRYYSKLMTSDSVILSQVKDGFEKQLQSYHVLSGNEVYSERPYKSSWLNINEQLDDIDKELGFPWSLKYPNHVPESLYQPDQGSAVGDIPAQTVSELPDSAKQQTQPEPVASSEEGLQKSSDEDASAKVASPSETAPVDSSDPFYSFEIKVLHPDDAKVVFDKIQSNVEQGQLMAINGSVEGKLPEALGATQNDSGLAIEEFCCISRWVEINLRPNDPPSKTCKCKSLQEKKNCAVSREEEETTGQKEDNDMVGISKFHEEGESRVKDGEITDNEIMTHGQSELCNNLRQTNSLTGNGPKCHTHSDKDSEDTSQVSIALVKDNEDEVLSSKATDGQFDPEMDSTGSTQSCTPVSSDGDNAILPRSESEVAWRASDREENCGRNRFTPTGAEMEEKRPQIGAVFSLGGSGEKVKRKHKRPRSHDERFPVQSRKRKPPSDVDLLPSTYRDVTDKTQNKPLASNTKTVQLVLYGSTAQEPTCLTGGVKRHNSFPGSVAGVSQKPPEVLSLDVNLKRRKSVMGEQSIKRQILEQWKRNYHPIKPRHRGKHKTQRATFSSLSGVSLKRTETVNPAATEKPQVASKTRGWSLNRNAVRCMSLKRRASPSERLRRGERSPGQDAARLRQPAHQERRTDGEKGSPDVPLQENAVLRFSVLPNTFNFKDGCNEGKEASDPPHNKLTLTLVKGKHKSSSKTGMTVKGTWCLLNPEKHSSLRKTSVPKTPGLFQEFQKKYMHKRQPAIGQ